MAFNDFLPVHFRAVRHVVPSRKVSAVFTVSNLKLQDLTCNVIFITICTDKRDCDDSVPPTVIQSKNKLLEWLRSWNGVSLRFSSMTKSYPRSRRSLNFDGIKRPAMHCRSSAVETCQFAESQLSGNNQWLFDGVQRCFAGYRAVAYSVHIIIIWLHRSLRSVTLNRCITTCQPDTKSNPNPYPNPTTKQHTIVNIKLNILSYAVYVSR